MPVAITRPKMEMLKRTARKMVKASPGNATHMNALNSIAHEYGYTSWAQLMEQNNLKQDEVGGRRR